MHSLWVILLVTFSVTGCRSTDITFDQPALSKAPETEALSAEKPKFTEAELGLPFYPSGAIEPNGTTIVTGPNGVKAYSYTFSTVDSVAEVILFYKSRAHEVKKVLVTDPNTTEAVMVGIKLKDGRGGKIFMCRRKPEGFTLVHLMTGGSLKP